MDQRVIALAFGIIVGISLLVYVILCIGKAKKKEGFIPTFKPVLETDCPTAYIQGCPSLSVDRKTSVPKSSGDDTGSGSSSNPENGSFTSSGGNSHANNCDCDFCTVDSTILCSGHGKCDGKGGCICDPGWSDTDCSVFGAVPDGMCYTDRYGVVCSGHGNCDQKSGMCFCNEGYKGLYCDEEGERDVAVTISKYVYAKMPSNFRPWIMNDWDKLVETVKYYYKGGDPATVGQKIVNNMMTHIPDVPLYNAVFINNIAQACDPGAKTVLTTLAKDAFQLSPDYSPY